MSRKIRKVIADGKHSKADCGKYKPQFEESYSAVLSEWLENKAKWDNGTHADLRNEPWLRDDCSNYDE